MDKQNGYEHLSSRELEEKRRELEAQVRARDAEIEALKAELKSLEVECRGLEEVEAVLRATVESERLTRLVGSEKWAKKRNPKR